MARKIDFGMSTSDIFHEIADTDTVESLCKQYHTSLQFILDKNDLTEQQLVDRINTEVGSTLIIPMIGDLVLGGEKRNDFHELMYVYPNGTQSTSPEIDGVAGKIVRDLAYVTDRDALKQIVMNRLNTQAPDWYHHPNMGGNLTDLIGEPNNRATADLGAVYIIQALTYDRLFDRTQIIVRPVPINKDEILFMVTLYIQDDTTFQLPLVFNLNYGIKEV